MAFNVQAGMHSMLKGMQADYQTAKKDRMEWERQQRLMNAQMAKEKEMAMWRAKQERDMQVQYRDEDLDYEISKTKKIEAAKGEMQREQGTLTRQQEVATRRAEGAEQGLAGEDLDRYALSGQLPAQTAAQQNMKKVDEILAKYEDPSKISKGDQMRLAVYGVKVPGTQQVKLTAEVASGIWKTARKEAAALFSPEVLGDDEAINQANALPVMKGRKVANASQARTILTDWHTMSTYRDGVSILTGVVPTETPEGDPLPEPTKRRVDIDKGPGLMQGHQDTRKPQLMATEEPDWGGTSPPRPLMPNQLQTTR